MDEPKRLLFFRAPQSVLVIFALLLAPAACVKRTRATMSSPPNQTTQKQANDQQPPSTTDQRPININTAAANELETLPGIGPGLAARIIEHRDRFGPFRRPEHLIIVRSISDRRFRALRDLVTVE